MSTSKIMANAELPLGKHDLVCPTAGALPVIPDDQTVVQFMLDSPHPTRPMRKHEMPWLIDDYTGRKVGIEELRSRTFGLANSLAFKYRIREKDVVTLISPNHVDYPVVIWATHRLGAILSCVNPASTLDDLIYMLEITKSTMLVVHPTCIATVLDAARVTGIPPTHVVLLEGAPNSGIVTADQLVEQGVERIATFRERRLEKGEAREKIAILCFSSGTTGKPKAVAIPHFAIIANVLQMAVHYRLSSKATGSERLLWNPGDVVLGVLPFFHIYGLVVNLHYVLFSAASVVVIPKFNFVEMLNSIARHKITHLFLVPPQAVLLCKHEAVKDYDLRHVRLAVAGAAPLSDEIVKKLMTVLPDAVVGQGYGLTETTATVSMVPAFRRRGSPNSCGQLLPGVICRVVKEDGSFGDFGDRGELLVKSPSNALGYLNNKQATKESFVDGFFRTGDVVVIDRDGEIYVVDRLKEIIKVKGFQVAPAELEGCLLEHPLVSDACVVGVPDEYSGEVPLAFVVLRTNTSNRRNDATASAAEIKAAIMKHVADKKTPYKRLAGVEFVDVIPKNPSGKLLRRLIREKAKSWKPKPETRAKL